MMQVIYTLVYGVFAVPPLSALAVGISTRCRPSRRPMLVRLALAILLVSAVAVALKISFAYRPANLWWLLVGYGAYCVLAAACFGLRPIWLRVAALLVAVLPIVAAYLFATFGIMGLVFIGGDQFAPPRRTELIRSGLSCDVRGWGMSFTDSGYEVHLRRFWPPAPFIWREVASVSVNETAGETGATCQTLLASYDARR